jgi:nicotinamide-nucleotide amidase
MAAPAPRQDRLEQLAQDFGHALTDLGWRLATAESCTGGWIAQCITAVAGSSNWFEAGVVSYSDVSKIKLLGVDAMLIQRHGAVSGETATAMAAGVRRITNADVAVSVTGIAGPGGGSAEKPVGTVWFGFDIGQQSARAVAREFPGNRQDIRARSVEFALTELLESLP